MGLIRLKKKDPLDILPVVSGYRSIILLISHGNFSGFHLPSGIVVIGSFSEVG